MTDQTSSSTTGSTPTPRQPRRGSAPQTTPQSDKGRHEKDVDKTSSALDPIAARAHQLLAKRQSFADRQTELDEQQKLFDLHQQAYTDALAEHGADLAKRQKKLNDEVEAHNKAHNIVVVERPKQIEQSKTTTEQNPQEASKPEQAQQRTLTDKEVKQRKKLIKRLDHYAGLSDNERPLVAFLCEESGLEFDNNLDKLRELLWMPKGAPLSYDSVYEAVNKQLDSRYTSEAPAKDKGPRTIRLFGGKDKGPRTSGGKKHI